MDAQLQITLRSFDVADVAPVQRLIHRTIDTCYSGVYPPRAVEFFKQFHSLDRILERHTTGEVLVVEHDGAVIATGAVVGDEITGVFVDPEHQSCGVGGRVMGRLEDIALAGGYARARLSVSLPSKGFYESRGYEILGSCSIDVGEGECLDYWAAEKPFGEPESRESERGTCC